ncbi:conserved hypothetical protein [Streptomyces sp. SPB78]|nr:conserved hypothetical protein [Streptomyces sp. SPB78]
MPHGDGSLTRYGEAALHPDVSDIQADISTGCPRARVPVPAGSYDDATRE